MYSCIQFARYVPPIPCRTRRRHSASERAALRTLRPRAVPSLRWWWYEQRRRKAMTSTDQCGVQVFNITSSVPRRAWDATLSLDALALERLPVIVTGLPDVQLWPALTAWSDLCARAPHLGRVFGGASRVFYHDNREKPFATTQVQRLPNALSA